jgi:hypothetical protein
MAEFSKVTITFRIDFELDYGLKVATIFNDVLFENEWDFVATRSAPFEITTGTPTATAGETTAINFASAFLLDFPTDFIVNQTLNTVEIISEVEGLDFGAVKAVDESNTAIPSAFSAVFDNYIIPVDNSNIEFALVNSPHYVNVPFIFDTTTSVTVDLYVWDGDLQALPVDPIYSLNIPRPSTNFAELNVDLSKLVQEKLVPKPTIDLTSTTQIIDSTSASVKWVNYVASYTDAVETIADIQGTFVAVDGYGYYSEGANPTKPTDNILTLAPIRKVSRDGFILFPFVNNGVITSINVATENTELNVTETVTSTDISDTIVQYLEVDVSQVFTDNYVTIKTIPSNDTITYEITDECRFEPIQVVFKNKYGVYDCLTLFKKSNESSNVNSSNFINNYITGGSYDTTKHQNQKINITATKTIKVNSGYISEAENTLYEQMLYSDTIYFYDGDLVPVNVKSSSLEFKTRVNDKLVNYSLDFDYAYNIIQNV